MALYVDSAYIDDARALSATYPIAGVTTNPSILLAAHQQGQRLDDLGVLRALLDVTAGPVFMQPTAETHDLLRAAALRYVEEDTARVVLKLPTNEAGLRLANELRPQGVRFSFTACYSLAQAYCAIHAGAEWIIPYFGRLRRSGTDPCARVEQMARLVSFQATETRILAASLKSPADVVEATLAGVHDVTVPPEVIRAMCVEPLTDTAVSQFAADWETLGREAASH